MDKEDRMPAETDAKLFEDLMAFHEAVFRVCLGFTQNPTEAEDLCQDIYLKACGRLGNLRQASSAREWLYRVARTTCLDHARRRRLLRPSGSPLRPEDIPDTRTPESLALAREQRALLKTAVGRLPRKLREVFVLREYGQLSYEELSRVLGAKAGTVMSRLNRARAAVARQIRERGL
jgi:RNA polymerase sigma-70 factor (ECF subfamily)